VGTTKVGLFGGSFDPVHFGHLILAEWVRDALQLDQLWFVPAAISPLKGRAPLATGPQRSDMVRLAIAGHDPFQLNDIELVRGDVSYTVDTLRALVESHPEVQFYWLLGSDALATLPQWKEPQTICRLAIPTVLRRRPVPEPELNFVRAWVPEDRFARIASAQVQAPLIEISSTEIRERLAAGRSIRYLVPRAVEKYIETHGLYGSSTGH
jgi:nicotinate-nucleotide adenylyltransferase